MNTKTPENHAKIRLMVCYYHQIQHSADVLSADGKILRFKKIISFHVQNYFYLYTTFTELFLSYYKRTSKPVICLHFLLLSCYFSWIYMNIWLFKSYSFALIYSKMSIHIAIMHVKYNWLITFFVCFYFFSCAIFVCRSISRHIRTSSNRNN